MVSKARLDLPEPDRPVKTIRASRGRSSEMLRRLCSRAPRTTRRFSCWVGTGGTDETVDALTDSSEPCARGRIFPRSRVPHAPDARTRAPPRTEGSAAAGQHYLERVTELSPDTQL